MKHIAKSSALIGSTEVALILVSIVRAKYLATSIGPEGYGEYALLNSFFTLMTAFSGGWIARGTIKYIAEYKQSGDLESVEKVYNISISLVIILTVIIAIICLLFSHIISENFISNKIILTHYYLFVASFLINAIIPFYGWLLQGFFLIKKTVYIRIFSTIFSFVSVLLLVYIFELTGFYLSILISAALSLILYLKATKGLVTFRFTIPNWNDPIMIKLLNFGGVNFILLIVTNISDFIQRKLIVSTLNMSSVGLFQVANSILVYMGIVNRGSLFYNDPKMAQELDIDSRNIEFNSYIRFNLLLGFPIAYFLILYSKELITILYTKEFLELSPILFFFVTAQLLQFLLGGLHSILLGKALLKVHSFASILSAIIVVALPFLFMEKFGLVMIGIGMSIANIVTFLIDYIYLNRKVGIRISKNGINLIIIGSLLLGMTYWIQSLSLYIRSLYLLISITFIFFSIPEIERNRLKILIINKIKK